MADPTIPDDDDDVHICPDCGAIHEPDDDDSEAEFIARSDLMDDALDGIEDPGMEMLLIGGVAGEFLAKFEAEHRDEMRAALINLIDEETRTVVIGQCDA